MTSAQMITMGDTAQNFEACIRPSWTFYKRFHCLRSLLQPFNACMNVFLVMLSVVIAAPCEAPSLTIDCVTVSVGRFRYFEIVPLVF